ncbi:MAG: hypothetical protein ACRYFS_09075 [Janthinobacterium lividum]
MHLLSVPRLCASSLCLVSVPRLCASSLCLVSSCLTCFALLFLACAASATGYYTGATYSGGTSTAVFPGGPISYPYQSLSGTYAWGSGSGSSTSATAKPNGSTPTTSTVTVTGAVTATFTWQGTDPAPPNAIVTETDQCVAGGGVPGNGNVSGPCDDGFGQSKPIGPGSSSATETGTRYELKGGSTATASWTPNVALKANSGTSGGANVNGTVSCSATISPVTLTLGGTTPDANGDGGLNILVGQGCTATLNGIPTALQPYTTYAWTVTGTTFESWSVISDPNSQSHTTEVDGPVPSTNPTSWYWNDLTAANEKVTCTATVTPPTGQGSAFNVMVVSKPISVQLPTSTANAIAGYMQVNMAKPDDITHNNLWAGPTPYMKSTQNYIAGMNWEATVTTPPSPAFGTGKLQMIQLVSPNNSYKTVANPTVTVTDSENAYSMSLDGTYPYGDVNPEMTAPAFTMQDNDSPSLQLDGANLLKTANKIGSYYDYLMYMPPIVSGCSSTWVVLATFNWSASGSATSPSDNNWSHYVSQNVVQNYAGAVTPPTTTPPQTGPAAKTPFTPVTKVNTFPKWTRADLPHTF